MKMKALFIKVVVVFLSTNFALAQVEEAKLNASDGIEYDGFGWRVSISGDYVLIGTLRLFEPYNCSAYIFKRDGETWTEQTKLTGSDCDVGVQIGVSVSLSGDYAIVGAAGDNDTKGSAYIFKRDGETWTERAKLTGSDCDSNAYFGVSVSLSGDYAIVGAAGDNDTKGSAYIFKRNGETWTEQAKLTGSDCDSNVWFGESVSLSGDYVIVGASGDDGEKGSAYIFKRDGETWTEQTKLTGSDCDVGARLGVSVSLSGDYVIVGASGANNKKGSAYIFKRDGETWTEQTKLTGSDCDVGARLGVSVSLTGDYVIVGADGDNDTKGSAYIFKRDGETWIEQAKLTGSGFDVNTYFGSSVSLSGDYAIVGAILDENRKGSAYVYDIKIFSLPPTTPTLYEIDNSNNDGNYVVSWSAAEGIVDYYTLQEDEESSFQSPKIIYTGKDTSKSIIARDVGTYFYRVNASNNVGTSDWSNIRSANVTIVSPTCDVCCGYAWVSITCESGSSTRSIESWQYFQSTRGIVTGFQEDRTYDNTGQSYSINGSYWQISSGGEIQGRIEVTVTGGVFGENVQYCQNYGDFINLAVDFEADPTSGTAPVTVHFTDNSTGHITTLLWDFGDGNSSTEQNPIHTYTNAGKYTVKLIANGSCRSDTLERADFIEVKYPTAIDHISHDIPKEYP
jgi:uncharacterized protein (DUF2345 family)